MHQAGKRPALSDLALLQGLQVHPVVLHGHIHVS